MRLICIGLSHKTAPLELREKLAFDPASAAEALGELHNLWPEGRFLLLSTCNRTELYTARALHGHPREQQLRTWLGKSRRVPPERFAEALYTYADAAAVRHIFSVTAGLESLVPGEAQIVSQLKGALAAAQSAGTAGAQMVRLTAAALHAAKHVRSETPIAEGKVSVASVAIECISEFFENNIKKALAGKCLLSVGGGKMNRIILQQVRSLGPRRIVVTNRSADRAEALAAEAGAEAAPFERLGELLADADVVVSSTASPRPVITAEMLRDALQKRDDKPILLVDLAVPRDVEPQAAGLQNVVLYNIDDLEQTVRRTLGRRGLHVEAAGAIIDEHVAQYVRKAGVRDVAPTVEAMYSRIESIIEAELDAARKKFSTHDDATEDMEILSRCLRRALRRFCHPATENLRSAAADGAGSAQAETIRKLFELP